MKSSELLLHPVRLRVVQAFLGDRELTTADLRADLPDIAPATLYRHVAVLADGGVLEVTREQKVRGSVERTYRLRLEPASVNAQDATELTAEDHRRAFGTFTASLLAQFEQYLDAGEVDLGRDQVGYRQAAMYLTDAEMTEMLRDLAAVLLPRLELPPGEGRTRRLVSTIVMPAR